MDNEPLPSLAPPHPLLKPALTLAVPALKFQPSVTHPRSQLIAPRSFLINSWTVLMPAKAAHSAGCQTSVYRAPGLPLHSSCTSAPRPMSPQHRRFWIRDKTDFPAAVSRHIHFLALELVISLMMQTSCQLSSSLNGSPLPGPSPPEGMGAGVKCLLFLLRKRLRFCLRSFKFYSQSLSKHC